MKFTKNLFVFSILFFSAMPALSQAASNNGFKCSYTVIGHVQSGVFAGLIEKNIEEQDILNIDPTACISQSIQALKKDRSKDYPYSIKGKTFYYDVSVNNVEVEFNHQGKIKIDELTLDNQLSKYPNIQVEDLNIEPKLFNITLKLDI